MFEQLRVRFQQGTPTASLPTGAGEMPARYRGLPILERIDCAHPHAPPSALLTTAEDGSPALDVGACLFSPEEAICTAGGSIRYTQDYRLASSSREGLITESGEIRLARALGRESRRLFGRSLRLRSVVAGSCGGCEAELTALGNVVFDLARFGVQFVASPRHADGIVLTGAHNRNMSFAVQNTYEATPAPRLVIAVGACAISGGPFAGSAEIGHDPLIDIPVDLYVPGCPPHPFTLLDGLLRLLGRLPEERTSG